MDVGKIQQILREGATKATELKLLLGVSQPTLSRWTKNVPNLVRIGETYHSTYAILEDVPLLGSEQGLYAISEDGVLKPVGVIKFLAAHQSALIPPGVIYDGFFPALYDMMPDGFMGRAFAQNHGSELGFPNQLRDWTDQQKLIAVAKRGEDLVGNLIFGRESAERWQQIDPQEVDLDDLPFLAKQAIAGAPAGSSAGGEQAKFSIFYRGQHWLVKFVRKNETEVSRRWVELLQCEHQALDVLNSNGVRSAKTEIVDSKEYLFLLAERFDRVGRKGRKPLISLSAVDNHFYGSTRRWSTTAERLFNDRKLSRQDLRKIKLIEAYSMQIADSDRHFHNLSLIPNDTFDKFSLAPVYDKLPMYFVPKNGEVEDVPYPVPIPEANLFDVWEDAQNLASQFWSRTNFRSFYL